MIDPAIALLVCTIFIFAGFVKGIVGNGLPVISIGLLTMIAGLPEAIALAVVPAFATNIWQAASGGFLLPLLRRLWPYLLASVLAVMLGTQVLISVDSSILTIVLGLLIGAYAVLGIIGKEFKIPVAWEKTMGPLFGFMTGTIAGMTGSPAYPGMYFLNGLGLTRNQLVQALGISFSTLTLAVAISMKSNSLLSMEQFVIGALAVLPAMLGMVKGAKLRHTMSEGVFKRLFYSSMFVLGVYLVGRSIFRLMW